MPADGTPEIDLNADLGEGVGDDAAMLELVSSANIACGFHAGTPTLLREVCARAVASGVRIGAQVSYPDREGFGRRFLDMNRDDLIADVVFQVGALSAIAASVGGCVDYVKPHGALYNAIVHHEQQAHAVVTAIAESGGLPLMSLPGSLAGQLAREHGIETITEAFADRAYQPDGTLVPRGEPGAVLTESAVIADRVLTLVRTGTLTASDGSLITVDAHSVCLHGDTPGAVDHARTVHRALADAGIAVRPRR